MCGRKCESLRLRKKDADYTKVIEKNLMMKIVRQRRLPSIASKEKSNFSDTIEQRLDNHSR